MHGPLNVKFYDFMNIM